MKVERTDVECVHQVSAHRWRIERVIQAMRDHVGEPWTLERLAEIAGISRYYFIRVFCQTTGLSPFQFLAALRLQAATRLLVTTDISVTDACLSVGYSSQGTFTRRFSERFGFSPQRLRRVVHAVAGVKVAELPIDAGCTGDGEELALTGDISAPSDFHGVVFIGLFAGRFSQSRPVASAVISDDLWFQLPRVGDGSYCLFAVALPSDRAIDALMLSDDVLRGRHPAQSVEVCNGVTRGPLHLSISPADLVDPPVMIGMAPVLSKLDALLH
jgi:AraC-like DNA-binding protein